MDGVVSLLIIDLLIYHLKYYLSCDPFMRTDESGTILDQEIYAQTIKDHL